MTGEAQRQAGARLRLLGGVLLLGLLLLGARAVELTLLDERGARRGRAQTGTVLKVASARGALLDRTGAELAVTMSAPSVYAVPTEVKDAATAARALAHALGRDASGIEKRLEQPSPFVFLARWTSEDEADAVRALELPGIGVVLEPRRTYPLGALAGPVIGFANIDGEGVRGAEQGEDEWLRGSEQQVALERDARGRLLARAGVDPRSAAGGDVMLTLDATLQAEMERALLDVVERSGARGGLALALDPKSGHLLGVAEHPGMDPNMFRSLRYAQTRSRSFLDAFESGSVLKPLIVASAIELGVLQADENIDCEQGAFRVPGKTLRDTEPSGLLSPADVLRVSSNIGVAKIAFRLEPRVHHAALNAFGLGRSSGSGFPDESAGLLRAPEGWRPLDQATIAFGQGVNVTAVQLAAATAVFANGGVWRAPQLVSARRVPGGSWRSAKPAEERLVLRPQVADALLEMLETVTGAGGTGIRASLEDVRVAGKTGTAQKFDHETGRYSNERYRSWFAGIAPADAPRVVVVTMIDEAKGVARGGGDTAAPLFARIASAALARVGIIGAPRFGLSKNAHFEPEPEAAPEAADQVAVASATKAQTRDEARSIRTAAARKQEDKAPASLKRSPLDNIPWLNETTPPAAARGGQRVGRGAIAPQE